MYDLYPDWGPAKNRTDESAMGSDDTAVRVSDFATRDEGNQRPDDN